MCLISNLMRSNKVTDSYIIIIDLKDYTRENISLDTLKKLNPIFSNYFPDVLAKMFIVNISYMAKMLYKTVSLVMHEVTLKKVV